MRLGTHMCVEHLGSLFAAGPGAASAPSASTANAAHAQLTASAYVQPIVLKRQARQPAKAAGGGGLALWGRAHIYTQYTCVGMGVAACNKRIMQVLLQ